MADETRVILVKPGDVLLVGNLGSDVHAEALSRAIGEFHERTGIMIYAFAADIDIDKIPAGDSIAMVARATAFRDTTAHIASPAAPDATSGRADPGDPNG